MIENNKIGKSNRLPKYLREHPSYSTESQNNRRQGYNSQHRDEDNKVLNLGIVGEQLGSNSSKKITKGNSLNMRLPKIGDSIFKERERLIIAQNSIDIIKLPNVQKYKHGKYFINKPHYKKYPPSRYTCLNTIDSNVSQLSKNYRYKRNKKANKDIYNAYIDNSSLKHSSSNKAMDKLKMYQNSIKLKK
jgi:hypothetical protein